MNGADHLFAIILLASGVLGYVRGFIRESIALLSWLIGLWVAWHYAYLVNPWLGGALAGPGVREWAGRAVVLLLVLLVGAAVGSITAHYMRRASGLAVTDRSLGALFGLMRGAVVIGLLFINTTLWVGPWANAYKGIDLSFFSAAVISTVIYGGTLVLSPEKGHPARSGTVADTPTAVVTTPSVALSRYVRGTSWLLAVTGSSSMATKMPPAMTNPTPPATSSLAPRCEGDDVAEGALATAARGRGNFTAEPSATNRATSTMCSGVSPGSIT